MFKTVIATAVAALMLSGVAFADQPGPDWMPKSQVIKAMEGQGFSGIVMEADDGHWEGEAVKDGKIVEFHADARTGKVTKLKPKTED
jgi:hypothetical protein